MFKALTGIALALALTGCELTAPPPSSKPVTAFQTQSSAAGVRFEDVTGISGLSVRNVSGSASQDFILETMSAGAAFLDYDGDGWLDLLTVNGTTLISPSAESRNRLFHNEPGHGDGRLRIFREVTDKTGLGSAAWGMGCAVGDYDNDADPDIYLTYWGPNQLLRNDGGGSFVDVTAEAAVGDDSWGSSAAFGDLDSDGLLDLYVTNYLEFDLDAPPAGGRKWLYKGLEVFYGPKGIPPQSDRLYRNDADGAFTDVSIQTGIADRAYPGLGVVFGDYDADGDLDIYVANDSEANQLYRNDGDWRFVEIGMAARVAYTEDGRSQAGMGVHGGDYDNDGDLDLFVTNFSEDVNTLYRNEGDWLFADVTARAGLDGVVRPFLGFGTAFFDYDNDGWLDLFVANGHLYPQLEQLSSGQRYAQRNLLYRNIGGQFIEVGGAAGPGLSQEKVSRASAFGDYDNDGDVDLFVMDLNDVPSLLRNDGGNSNAWIGLELEGVESNRDAIGASVRVGSGSFEQTREVHRGYGFQSQHDPRLLFGLGESQESPRVEIRWPSGTRQVLDNLPLRRYVVVREGDDAVVAEPVPAAPPAEDRTTSMPPTQGSTSELRHSAPPPPVPHDAAPESADSASNIDLGPQQLYQTGRMYYAEGRLEDAAAVLAEAVRRDPGGDRAYLLLGKTYLNLNRDQSAIDALEKAQALDPLNWEYANFLGVAYKRVGRTDDALAVFVSATRNTAWAPRPHLNLARLYADLDQPGAAAIERRLFEQLEPLQRQVELTEDLLSAHPDNPRVHRNLGFAYAKQGRQSDALAEFQRASELDPDDGMARYGLGDVLHRQRRFDEAIEAYKRALELVPDDAAIHTSIGMAHAALGESAEASTQFERALELDPDHARAHFGVGELHLRQRNAAEAIRACERAVLQQSDFALAHSCLGKAYAADGRYDDAIGAFGEALELDARLVQPRFALGVVFRLQKRYEESVREWERVLQLAPDHAKARQGIVEAKRELEAQ